MGDRSRKLGIVLLVLLLGQAVARAAPRVAAPLPEVRGATPVLLPAILRDSDPALPIVLVHGWQGGNLGLPCQRHGPEYVDATWGLLDEYLGEGFTIEEPAGSGHLVHRPGLGFHVELARLYSGGALLADGPNDPNWHCTPVVEENVPNLREAIDAARAATGQSRVILISHSMGGLVSRAYLESGGYRGDVAMLVTLGTPHVGIPVDVLYEWVSFITLGTITLDDYCQAQPAVCQFADDESDPDYPAGYTGIETFNALYSSRAPGVRYHFLGGDAGFFDRGWFGAVVDAILVGPDDGIVPLPSALGESSADGRLPPLSGPIDRQFLYPVLHIDDFTDAPDCVPPDSPQRRLTFKGQDEWVDPCLGEDYINRYIPPSAYLTCLAPQLNGRAPDLACGTVTNLDPQMLPPTDAAGSATVGSATTVGGATATARLPRHSGELADGETVALPFDLSGGAAYLVVAAGPADEDPVDGGAAFAALEVTLRDPQGRFVDDDQAVVFVQRAADRALYRLDAPRAGRWTMEIVARGAARYVTLAVEAGPPTLTWTTAAPFHIAGGSADLLVTLDGSVAEAAVSATLRLHGAERTVNLAPAGLRQYRATLPLPDVPGTAQLTLSAAGTTITGRPFARERVTILPIGAAGAAIRAAGSPALRAGADAGFADLVLPVDLHSAAPLDALLAGRWVDGAGQVVAGAFSPVTLGTGDQRRDLIFAGRSLAAGAPGPYRLDALWLLDAQGQVLAQAEDLQEWLPETLARPGSILTAGAPAADGPALICTATPAGPYAPGDTVQLSVRATSAGWLDYVFVDAPSSWTVTEVADPPPDASGWQRPTNATLCASGQTFWGIDTPYLAPLSDACDLRADRLPPGGSFHGLWSAAGAIPVFAEGFEGSFPPAGWAAIVTAGAPNDGFQLTTDSPYSGAAAVRHDPYDVCFLCSTPRSWLVTPRLRVRAGDELVFWQQVSRPERYERRAIYISVGSPNPADGDFQPLVDLGPAADTAWQQVRVSLDDFAARDDVYLAFYYEGDDADRWTIDDVTLDRPVTAPASIDFNVTYQVPAAACPGSPWADLPQPVLAVGRDDALRPGTGTATCIPVQPCPVP